MISFLKGAMWGLVLVVLILASFRGMFWQVLGIYLCAALIGGGIDYIGKAISSRNEGK